MLQQIPEIDVRIALIGILFCFVWAQIDPVSAVKRIPTLPVQIRENLATLLWKKGDYAGAEPLYRRALAIDEKALGPEHPATLQIQKNLATLLEPMTKEK